MTPPFMWIRGNRDIADALLPVLTRPDLARDLVERRRVRTSTLRWEASVRAHLAVFDHVARLDLKGRPVSPPTKNNVTHVVPRRPAGWNAAFNRSDIAMATPPLRSR